MSVDRLTLAEESEDPRSLVGSFFHGDASRQWQGCVVAEPAPGWYLVECFGWLDGSSNEQCLVRLEEMKSWHFYDCANWMNNSIASVRRKWEAHDQRVNAEGGPT